MFKGVRGLRPRLAHQERGISKNRTIVSGQVRREGAQGKTSGLQSTPLSCKRQSESCSRLVMQGAFISGVEMSV